MTTPAYEIALEEDGGRGRYVIKLPDGLEAEMTFQRQNTPDGVLMIIDHTGVPEAHEGKGLAFQLLTRAVADARAQNSKIRPRCSYVVAQFARHAKEWADVLG